jgi:galactokinase/mevalonate kinase-like predicted kinase
MLRQAEFGRVCCAMFDSLNRNFNMTLVAKAPCRVDVAGGTIDIWPLYLFHTGAVTLNFAVNRYASCRLAARLLRQDWSNRKQNAPGITIPLTDRLVDVARRNGSVGAKACGAGGGGCILFLVERGAKQRVAAVIAAAGAAVLPVCVAPQGVHVLSAAE